MWRHSELLFEIVFGSLQKRNRKTYRRDENSGPGKNITGEHMELIERKKIILVTCQTDTRKKKRQNRDQRREEIEKTNPFCQALRRGDYSW